MTDTASQGRWRDVAGSVADPEIPVLTLSDLGIVRDVQLAATGSSDGTGVSLVVILTPTYTGCPATAVIAADVTAALRAAGADRVEVRTVLSPAWTTDWISDDGRRKLTEYGIAPPGRCVSAGSRPQAVGLTLSARCPRCGSMKTREVSRFGSTPCKSHWTCRSCLEPFDSFKAI
ncbi:MAG: 1,2-phenylacetyl-CoA epoxidase subunit PaaD [Nakamurella sp.]